MTGVYQIQITPKQRKSLPTRGIKGSTKIWMSQKVQRDTQLYDDNSSDLWIVENKLYDLKEFAHQHPGGTPWIQKTKGQDITEHFIVHHLNENYARSILQKYYVRDCEKQNSRFTFKQDGLYRVIKNQVLKQIKISEIQDESITKKNGIIILIIFLCSLMVTAWYSSYIAATICSILLIGIVGVAHNFIHHKQNLFRYLFALTGFTHHEWQIMHCISHHIYPNTELDYQIAAFQPIAYFLRNSPSNLAYTELLMQVLFVLIVPLNMLLKVIIIPIVRLLRPDFWYTSTLSCFILFYIFSNDLWVAFKLYFYMYGLFAFLLMKVLFCGHRLQQLWSQGAKKIQDFGEHTILATSDTDIKIQGILSIVFFAGFNIHVAHHLFPTADHSKLPQIMKIIIKICEEKNIKYTQTTRFQCIKSVSSAIAKRIKFDEKKSPQ